MHVACMQFELWNRVASELRTKTAGLQLLLNAIGTPE